MNRGDYSKNAKKKWGSKMEELATMVERAQLEKIQWNKKNKRGKLSKKEYLEEDSDPETPVGKGKGNRGTRSEEKPQIRGRFEKEKKKSTDSPNSTRKSDKHRNGSTKKPHQRGNLKKGQQAVEFSSSCPSGFLSSNKGRSISFTGGPNLLYSQFNYTYTYEDNSGKVKYSFSRASSSDQALPAMLDSSQPLKIEQMQNEAFAVAQHNEDDADENDTSDTDSSKASEDDVGLYLTDDGASSSSSDFMDCVALKFGDEDVVVPLGAFELEADGEEAENEDDDDDDDGGDGDDVDDNDDDGDEDDDDESDSDGESVGDDDENEEAEFLDGDEDEDFNEEFGKPIFSFSHPDGNLSANALNSVIEKNRRKHIHSDDDDVELTAYGRRRKRKILDRDRVFEVEFQFGGDGGSSRGVFSTPQQNKQQSNENEGPHSWPKKSNFMGRGREKQLRDKNESNTKKGTKLRDKKKKQVKSKYVKAFLGAYGTSTTARGWVEGGTVKDDDLIKKFSDLLPSSATVIRDILEAELAYVSSGADVTTTTTSYSILHPVVTQHTHIPVNNYEPNSTPRDSIYTNKPNKPRHKTDDRAEEAMDTGLELDAEKVSMHMTPKEIKIYNAILDGNFRSLDANEAKRRGKKSKRYPAFDLIEVARLVEDCNDFVNTVHRKSMSLPSMTKEQRIQVYALATLYNFKKDSVGKGGNRSPVLLKGKKTAIPHRSVLAHFVQDCACNPFDMKSLYLSNEQGEPPRASMAQKLQSRAAAKDRARFVGENARPVSEDNIGNRMLRGMGWSGGGLGANGEGITEPIAQKIKVSRSGLG